MTAARRNHFWLISLGVHIVVLAVLLLSPAGERIFTREVSQRPEVVRHGDDLARVVDDIRDLTAERLRAQALLLASGQQRMAQNLTVLNAHYQPRAAAQAMVAQERFAQVAADVQDRQRLLLTAAAAADADPDGATAALGAILGEHQARLTTNQEEVRRSLHLLAADREDLLAEQRALEKTQLEAFQFLGWSRDADHGIRRHRERLAALPVEITTANDALAEAETALAAATEALATARTELAAAEERARRAAENRVRQTERQERDARTHRDRSQQRLTQLTGETAQIAERLTETIANRNRNLGIGHRLQANSLTRQAAVIAALNEQIAATGSKP